MFLDSEVAIKFTHAKTKCSYLMNDGAAPFFKHQLTKCINNSPFYSLSFGESMKLCIAIILNGC